MDRKERMKAGLIYDPGDPDILEEQCGYQEILFDFNQTRPSEDEKRQELMRKMFASIGERTYIMVPMHANFGCHHVHMGSDCFANYNLTLVDDGNIYIGDKVMIGPNVTIATANHPIAPELRAKLLQYNKDVRIGDNVWIGSGVCIMPGVSIGENTVIGAGSIVTKDIPADVVAYGNPCRVIRPIGEHDHEYFYKDEKIDWENL